MKNYKILKNIYICLALLSTVLLVGCSKSDETPASPASPNETRWAWKAVSTVSPKWNEQKTFILNANLWLRTFPTGSGNATYKQIITDYAPTVALSGKSSATLDLSTGEIGRAHV